MTPSSTSNLLVRLGVPAERPVAAQQLARAAGAEQLVLLVRDSVLGVFLPAPGMPQTLKGGPLWRQFAARCASPGHHEGEVDLPVGSRTRAEALSAADMIAIFVGGRVAAGVIDELRALLPLLGAALQSELQVLLAASEADEARRAAGRAETLAQALEAARAEHVRLNAELTAEHRRKDEFLAMLAHELRNPLTPLVHAVELLRRRALDAADQERMLDVAGRQLNQLNRLVEDLLDVSRVSRGRIELRRERLALGETLEHALEASRPALLARRHDFTLLLPQEPLWVYADSARLTQVFSNLLHNAAKYTDPGGVVTVQARREGEMAEVSVKDTGIGIAPEMLPKVFDLFTQVPSSLARAHGGLGIGLTLVRSLVELHGGEVSAESEGPASGSRFVVRLPLAGEVPEARPATQLAAEEGAVQPLRVLVVDDNQDAADTLAALLRVTGNHHVEAAYSGAGALRIAGDLDPDLVFLDLGLPELDGFEVAARLRRSLRRHAHFVALTGYGTEADKRRTREAGFDEHLVKPVDAEELGAAVRRAMARQKKAAA